MEAAQPPNYTITPGITLFSPSEIRVVRGTQWNTVLGAVRRAPRACTAAGCRASWGRPSERSAALPPPHCAAPAGGAAARALLLQGAAEEPVQVFALENWRAAFFLHSGKRLGSGAHSALERAGLCNSSCIGLNSAAAGGKCTAWLRTGGPAQAPQRAGSGWYVPLPVSDQHRLRLRRV